MKLFLGAVISERRGTGPTVEFLGVLAGKHDFSERTFPVDSMGYLTALALFDLPGHLTYVEQNLIEKWFQTLTMRFDRFHQAWMGGIASSQPIVDFRNSCSLLEEIIG